VRKWLSAIPAVILLVVAVWEIGATPYLARSVPGDDAWARADAIVRMGYKRGDLIVFAPGWVDPIGRLFLGDLIPIDMAARMDADRYGRIWELSIRGATAPEVAGLSPVEDRPGPVTVRRYERTPVTVLSDLTSAVKTADRPVRADLVEVAFEPHRCILVPTPPVRPYLDALVTNLDLLPPAARDKLVQVLDHVIRELPQVRGRPAAERAGTRIVFRGLPLGSRLVGYVGIADVFTRREDRAPVTLAVDTGGTQTKVTAPIDRWVRFETPTTPGTGDVAVTLRWEAAPGELWGNKQVCFTAEARR